jgi:hypothetical protein
MEVLCHNLNLGVRCKWMVSLKACHCTNSEGTTSNPWSGGYVSSRAFLEILEYRKIFYTCRKSKTNFSVVYPTAESPYWLMQFCQIAECFVKTTFVLHKEFMFHVFRKKKIKQGLKHIKGRTFKNESINAENISRIEESLAFTFKFQVCKH